MIELTTEEEKEVTRLLSLNRNMTYTEAKSIILNKLKKQERLIENYGDTINSGSDKDE